MRPRPLSAIVLTLAAGACRRAPPEVESSPGVRVEVTRDSVRDGVARLAGDGLSATLDADPHFLDVRLLSDGAVRRGPMAIEVAIASGAVETPLSLRELHAGRAESSAVATAKLTREAGDAGEIQATLDARARALFVTARVRGVERGAKLVVRAKLARRGSEVRLGDVPPERVDVPLARTMAPFAIVGQVQPIVLASQAPLAVEASVETLVATSEVEIDERGRAEASTSFSIAPSVREAAALGARASKGPRRKGAEIAVEVRERLTGRWLPARVMVDGTPREKTDAPMVLDPSREAEQGAPLVDAYRARTSLSLPAGHWTVLVTHGIGWSIAKATLDLDDGDAVRLPFELVEEAPLPGWIGCDLHVHARGSIDARAVSYEDRVRSLAAVGVDCAAATEHDHVGDHAPAAKALGLDPIFRGMPGVELTTNFGHFNAYPWPDGAKVPLTKGTTPAALFGAVRALPGGHDLVLQVNHPHMRIGSGTRIGYFDFAGYDGTKGIANGEVPYVRDYDALEVFNGYNLPNDDVVLARIDEWLAMIEHDDVHVATGSSDSHWIQFPWAGFPRTYVHVGPLWVAQGKPFAGIAQALKQGRAIVTSGPILDLRVGEAGVGDEAHGGATARVEVRATSWLGEPTLKVRLGREELRPTSFVRSPLLANTWVAEVAIPKVEKKRPLVAIATAKVLEDGRVVKGMTTAVGFTNPVWIVP